MLILAEAAHHAFAASPYLLAQVQELQWQKPKAKSRLGDSVCVIGLLIAGDAKACPQVSHVISGMPSPSPSPEK